MVLPQAYAWGYMLWPLRGLITLQFFFSENTLRPGGEHFTPNQIGRATSLDGLELRVLQPVRTLFNARALLRHALGFTIFLSLILQGKSGNTRVQFIDFSNSSFLGSPCSPVCVCSLGFLIQFLRGPFFCFFISLLNEGCLVR